MIDPKNITNFNLTVPKLEEHMLFWICAAGKNGITAAKCLSKLLIWLNIEVSKNTDAIDLRTLTPFKLVREMGTQDKLAALMKESGIGCYTIKARTFWVIANSRIDLKTCTVDDLEKIPGIGPKTARCFLIHSRPNQKLAGLDRHILRFLKDQGYNVPSSTPTGDKYKEVEQIFIEEANKRNKTIAELDLEIWNEYRDK